MHIRNEQIIPIVTMVNAAVDSKRH